MRLIVCMNGELSYPGQIAEAVSDLKTEFLELVGENQGIIHKVCNMYCNSEEDRRDLFQEILLQLWKGYKAFQGASKPTTWMYRVALNTAISSLRKTSRRPVSAEISPRELELPGQPERDPETEEKLRFIYKAIWTLSDVEKAIVMLYLDEYSYDEIAGMMGITRNHVGVKLNRIKNKLKELVQPHFS